MVYGLQKGIGYGPSELNNRLSKMYKISDKFITFDENTMEN